jgi:hypothetical protein
MTDIGSVLPLPLMIGIMVLGVVLVLVACAPTAWVDRAHREIRKRQQDSKPKQ